MSLKGKQIFIRKTSKGGLYKWSPLSDNKNKKNNIGKKISTTKQEEIVTAEFCNAKPNTPNGEDSITKYVTKTMNVEGTTKYLAYVECNYVK